MNKSSTFWTLFKIENADPRDINRYQVHKALTRCIVDDSLPQSEKDRIIAEARVLFAVKPTDYGCKVIVQSAVKPDWSRMLPVDREILGEPAQEQDMTREVFNDGMYEITLDTRACKSTTDGKKVFLKDTESKRDWVKRFFERRGAQVEYVRITPMCYTDYKTHGNQQPKTVRADSFTLVAKITDQEQFNHCLKNGVGRQKMNGLGMVFARRIS